MVEHVRRDQGPSLAKAGTERILEKLGGKDVLKRGQRKRALEIGINIHRGPGQLLLPDVHKAGDSGQDIEAGGGLFGLLHSGLAQHNIFGE